MGAIVFDNFVFDSWLTKKSDEILSKVDREKISNEDMLILILKAQTNHFHHMDVEFRDEFGIINQRFENINQRFEKIDERFEKIDERFEKIDERFEKIDERFEKIDERFEKIDERFVEMESKFDQRFEKMESRFDQRFEKMESTIDQRFEKVWNFHKWHMGLLITLFAGLYLKLFFG